MDSMTGFGRGGCCADGREITIEVKSVNHRFLDPAFRLPRNLGFLEEILRRELSASEVKRGHIEVSVLYRNTRADAQLLRLDPGRLEALLAQLSEQKQLLASFREMTAAEAMTVSGALLSEEEPEDQEAVAQIAREAFSQALSGLLAMRRAEGENLRRDLSGNLSKVAALRDRIASRAPEVPRLYRERLLSRMAEWPCEGLDETRVAQEVALLADKCAIDEELSRLESHIAQFADTMDGSGDAGKKLDFLLQEMNREVNTIGSKASDLEITKCVVDAKCLLEKLREQVQNVQ